MGILDKEFGADKAFPMLKRRFEPVHNERGENAILPERATERSAGYDLATAEDVVIPAHGVVKVGTGLKVHVPDNETFLLANRSSSPKKGFICPLGIGVIDADYYDNPGNEGEIFVILIAIDGKEHKIPAHTNVAQGLFVKYGVTDDDHATGTRVGGIGSTDKH